MILMLSIILEIFHCYSTVPASYIEKCTKPNLKKILGHIFDQ